MYLTNHEFSTTVGENTLKFLYLLPPLVCFQSVSGRAGVGQEACYAMLRCRHPAPGRARRHQRDSGKLKGETARSENCAALSSRPARAPPLKLISQSETGRQQVSQCQRVISSQRVASM